MSDANLELAQKIIDMTLKCGADSADAIVSDSASLGMSARNGKLEDTERAESRDLGLRAMIGQQQAFVSGSAIDEDALQQLAQRAVDMANTTPADRFCGFAPEDRLAETWPDLDLEDPHEPSAEALRDMALACEAEARRHEGITNSEGAGASWARGTTALATSHGFAGSYTSTHFSMSCSAIGGTGDAMEGDYASHSTHYLEDLDSPEEIGRRTAERTLARLNPRKMESTKAHVVFDKRVSASMLGHLAGAISGSAIARGTSFLREDMGKQVMSQSLQVIDDPHLIRGLRSTAFDGEGVAPEKFTPIENGVLTSWFLNSATARQLDLQTNGRAGRGTGGPPSPSPTNLYMAAGQRSVADILKDIGTGFYITDLIGMGVNGVTGDYSRGASGFWIENGEIAFPVSEMTIAGNLRDMFMNMTAANDLDFRRGVNAPTLLIENMALAGL
ncbi:TldD/PmbA family protein [bacterium]|nr:TldD/PmbA family protein [bacterium]